MGDSAPTSIRSRWASPPRSGLRRLIAPWEYRRPRAWARGRLAAGLLAAVIAVLVLALGGSDAKTYAWTAVFAVIAAANWAWAWWDVRIARSQDG